MQTAGGGARAARRRGRSPVRASGALERYANQIDDPFTAAVVVASGLVDEGRAEGLRDMVRQALLSSDDGRVRVDGLAGVRNVWGSCPGRPRH